MFKNCASLTSLDLSNFNTENLEIMVGMFANNGKLEYLDISNFNTSNANNMDSLFDSCKSLKILKISGPFWCNGPCGITSKVVPSV